jgi:DNA polymerase-3 subunit epsilon
MNLFITDTETTGLHPEKGDKVIEIAGLLYNVEHKTILQSFSTLYPCETNPVEHINGIKPAATNEKMPRELVEQQISLMLKHSDAVVAHNAQFDRNFIRTLNISEFNAKPWICTRDDFFWPVSLQRKRLQDICEAFSIQYTNAHRAINDCMFLVDCLNKVEDLTDRVSSIMKRKVK